MARRKERAELESAEIRLQSLIEKRDALNSEATVFRDERDLLHAKRRELLGEIRSLREARSAFFTEARSHRARRDELQRKARELIDLRRKTRGKVGTSVGAELDRMRRNVQSLEMKQQTSSLTLEEEDALLDELREKSRELRELESMKADENRIGKEIKDIDASINDLLRAADAEHEQVVKLSGQARAKRDEIDAMGPQLSALSTEADKKHAEFLKIRDRADEYHQKAVDMRKTVLATREAQRSEIREVRDLVRKQNLQVRRTLLDDEKRESAADDALRALLSKGRVEIKG